MGWKCWKLVDSLSTQHALWIRSRTKLSCTGFWRRPKGPLNSWTLTFQIWNTTLEFHIGRLALKIWHLVSQWRTLRKSTSQCWDLAIFLQAQRMHQSFILRSGKCWQPYGLCLMMSLIICATVSKHLLNTHSFTVILFSSMRVLPQQQDTGGFFISLLKKVKPLPWEKPIRLEDRQGAFLTLTLYYTFACTTVISTDSCASLYPLQSWKLKIQMHHVREAVPHQRRKHVFKGTRKTRLFSCLKRTQFGRR